MASSVHPFQPYPGDNMNRPPSNQFYPYATGGHAVYMNTNDASAAPPPNNGVTYAYGAPNTTAYAPGGANLQGTSYEVPAHLGHPAAGQPSGAQGYLVGVPGAQGYLVGPPGAQMLVLGPPNSAGYNPPSSSQSTRQAPGYQPPRPQDTQVGMPSYSVGAPAHSAHTPVYQSNGPGYVQGEQGYPQTVQVYPPGEPSYLAMYPVYMPSDPGQATTPAANTPSTAGYPGGAAAYTPVAPTLQYPADNGNVYGYPMQAMSSVPGTAQGFPGSTPTGAPGGNRSTVAVLGAPAGVPTVTSHPTPAGYHSGTPNGISGGSPASAPGFRLGESAVVYPAPVNGASEAVKHQLESDNKGTPADQQLVKYPPPQHQVQQGGQQQPSSVNPRDQIETGRWAAGLCSCCDNCVPNCMMTMCLPFVSLAQIYSRMGLMPFSAGLLVFFILYAISFSSNFLPNTTETTTVRYSYGGYTSYQTVVYSTPNPMVLPLTAAGLAGQLVFRLFVWRARAAIRGRYDIPGSCCGDCCAVYWCSCCAVAQMATHVKSYRPGSCGFGAPATLPAYASS